MMKNDLKQTTQEKDTVDDRNKKHVKEKEPKYISCTSLAWNKSDDKLYAGFSDHFIRVYQIEELTSQD